MRHITRKILTKTASLAGVAAIALSATAVNAMPFENTFIFGDSLVDSGNRALFDGTEGALAPLGYFEDRISNGPALGDLLTRFTTGEQLASPSISGGNNFSYAGARIRDNTNDLGPNSDDTPDLAAQVGQYLTSGKGPATDNDLFVINAGGNDIRDFGFGIPAALDPLNLLTPAEQQGAFLTEIVETFVTQVVTLELAGAQNILIMGIPDASRAPEAIAFANTLPNPEGFLATSRGGSELVRDLILSNLALRPDFGTDLRFFDYLPFTDAFVSAPEDFGFAEDVNVTDACLGNAPGSGTPDIDCSGFAFFDSIHPTTELHEQIARAALADTFGIRATEVSEPATLALLGLGLAGVVTLRRRKAA